MTIDEFLQEGQPGSSACPGNLLDRGTLLGFYFVESRFWELNHKHISRKECNVSSISIHLRILYQSK